MEGRTLLTVVRFPLKRVWGPNMNVGRQLPNPMEGRTGQIGTQAEQKMFNSKWRLQGHMAGIGVHP